MLAQGQFSSAKRGGLAADVSSGLIFLKKKKDMKGNKEEYEKETVWRTKPERATAWPFTENNCAPSCLGSECALYTCSVTNHPVLEHLSVLTFSVKDSEGHCRRKGLLQWGPLRGVV